jgi:hypothetical protein
VPISAITPPTTAEARICTSRPVDHATEPLLFGRQRRNDRLHRRVEERVAGGQASRHDVGVPGALWPQQGQHQARSNEVGPDQDGLAAEAVDHHAGHRSEHQDRDHLGGHEAGDGHALARQLEHEHHERDVVQRVAEVRDELAEPQGKVARARDHAAIRPRYAC